MNYDNWKQTDKSKEVKDPMKDKDLINEFIETNWNYYKEWLNEHIGYVGGIETWDDNNTRYEYCEENIHDFLDFVDNYEE